MISYDDFGKLRLAQFVDRALISETDNWEFRDHLWVGEALEFSEWLRLKSEPTILRSLALSFPSLLPGVAGRVLETIRLPLEPGMTYEEIEAVLGPPFEVQTFVKDRKSYEFHYGKPDQYHVSCTVHDSDGLIYLVVTTPLPPS